MKKYSAMLAFAAILPLVGCSTQSVAPLSMGETLNLKGLEDQNGQAFQYQNTMKNVLLVEGMSAKNIAQKSFEAIDTACMARGELVYLADISGMPSLISNMVAIPKMQDYAYPVWLDREGDTAQGLPTQEGQVSLIKIEQGTMTQVDYYDNVATLTKRLIEECGTQL